MSTPQMTRDEFYEYLKTREIKPPHIVFDQAQYDRDVRDGLISISRNINNSPYLPSELKAVHNAADLNVLPLAGKKKVVIAITIPGNWPAAYVQNCFNAFCSAYEFAQRDIEVINLAPLVDASGNSVLGNPSVATAQQASVNQSFINGLSNYIIANGSNLSNVIPNNRDSLTSIEDYNYNTGSEENDTKSDWLGELILNFWAIAMNPNAHFRIINAASSTGYELENSVIYASTDSNFANNPHGTTDYINMSWGDPNPGVDRATLDDSIFLNPKICYFAAAGNSRWAGYPSTSSNVMCVGGASLNYNHADPINSSTNPFLSLWVGATNADPTKESPGGGTGFSHSINNDAYSRPAYQIGLAALASYSTNPKRACPDMCSLADSVTGLLVIFTNSDGTMGMVRKMGGTSLASPLLAGLFSHLSQRLINEDKPPLTTRLNDIGSSTLSNSVNLQTFLYSNYTANASSMFYDIVVGSTTLYTDANLGPLNSGQTFSAGSGYDIATGLGVPQMNGIKELMFAPTPAPTPAPTSLQPNDIKFYLGNSVTPTPLLSGTVSDQRNYLDIFLESTEPSKLQNAIVSIARKTGDTTPTTFKLKLGANSIGNTSIGPNEIAYADAANPNGKFEDSVFYTIKIIAYFKNDTGGEPISYASRYGTTSSLAYSFFYRADGGDQFTDNIQDPLNPELYEPVCKVTNETVIEGAAGSNILVDAPIHFANSNDTRTPTHLTFTFDEANNYLGTDSDTANVEQISEYTVTVPYHASGKYTLPQTATNKLKNDKGYYVSVMATYSDGYYPSWTFYLVLHVIERPVIQSVVAYGLASDQSDANEPAISSVMNVYMVPYSTGAQVNLPSSTDEITFHLSQGGVVMYKAVMPVSTVITSDTILYTILKADLEKVWTTTAPTQESNGSYKYDVTANIVHYTLYQDEYIARVSNSLNKSFTSDIVSLPSVVALNAWVAAANVAGSGNRTVDISNATTENGYTLAPELGIVGKFSKNDFYGTGITDGFFQDLDAVGNGVPVTNHGFTVSVNGTVKTVTELYQIQGHSNKSDQELYIELFESVNNGPAVSKINGVETVLTESQLQGVKADSNPIISIDDNESGWTIMNTGPNTNGATGGKLPKVNLYFYTNTTAAASQTASNSFTLNQASGVGMYAVFHQNAGANKYPALYTYTTPTSSGGVNKASWYKSRIVYASINDNAGDTVADQTKIGLTLIYTGTDDATLFPHIPSNRRVKYEIKYGENLTNSNSDENAFSQELVNMLALMTSSVALPDVNAGSYNFHLLETGIFTSNANFDQVKLRYNVLSRNHTNVNGSFRNLPGPAGVLGSAQQPIYFWIPHTGLFNQTDSVKVNIAIQPPAGETTRPSATESNAQVVVAKVNTYVMTAGTKNAPNASEPKFANGTLTVPINNAKTIANEYYFSSAIFTSNNTAPNDLKEVSISNGGVFDIAVVNPSIRGAVCDYQVRYKITDPNAVNGTITGPISATYSIMLEDEPGLNNFNVTNFSYDTFNNNDVSKIRFDIAFSTVGTTTIDGVYVYFQSANDDANDSNDIPLTMLMDVSRATGETQTNLSYILQSAIPSSSATGVKIFDMNGSNSVKEWLNFRSGDIVFKPYIYNQFLSDNEPDIQNVQLVRKIYNIHDIAVPTNLTLTGGVKESHSATNVAWNDALSAYASMSSSVTASYKLLANGTEVSGQVASHGYTIDLSSYVAGDAVALTLQVKITTAIDGLVYLSDAAGLNFVVASVNTSGLSTITVKRGSNENTLKVTRGDVVITPISGATVTEVKLIDNLNVENTDPTHASVEELICTSTAAAIQPAGPTTVNDYNLAIDGYVLGDVIDMQYRAKAGVFYTVTYGSASPVSAQSTPLYLTLQAAEVKYVVAKSPELAAESSYRMVSSGTYAGRIAINVNINANGLHAEGLQSVVFVLAQEGDATNPALSAEGVQHMIAFESSSGLTKSYIVGPNASLLPSSTDNLGATEVQEVSVLDVDGFTQ